MKSDEFFDWFERFRSLKKIWDVTSGEFSKEFIKKIGFQTLNSDFHTENTEKISELAPKIFVSRGNYKLEGNFSLNQV